MTDPESALDCEICRGAAFDREFGRTLVWQDALWRLSTSHIAPLLGFSYLEPRRHIPHITDLNGREAATLGPVLAKVTGLLQRLTDADHVYVMVFGEHVAHLHFNLAPHHAGDALRIGKDVLDPSAPPLSAEEHGRFIEGLTQAAGGL